MDGNPLPPPLKEKKKNFNTVLHNFTCKTFGGSDRFGSRGRTPSYPETGVTQASGSQVTEMLEDLPDRKC